MTRTFSIKEEQQPTEDQLREVELAEKNPIQYDDDSPELSPAMYKAFQCTVAKRNRMKRA